MTAEPATGATPPERIGPYRILETLGEGGMGTVYLAEQKEPVRRRVALKVIKLGMDSKAVLTRFEAERKALGMMEHSCIATVFDAGVTEQGQPFFAMEYVKGIPITDYCDQNKLELKERIELLQKVCSGVQHAHLKGVMHRDLKPSNVLVTLQDGKPMPKIIDFGLAKATDHHLVEATLFTEQGVLIGTPEYMSPEQAGLGGLDVDTRTDVYSLGVLLYELLVGELPFSRKELRNAGHLEMQRMIREQEPQKPSTKITTLGDAAGAHAASRRLGTGELQRKLRGDLDWIVLRALEKDRTRRYETALELAADLERHLNFEPVLASPPSVGYRVKKFVRRYRPQCLAAAVVLLAIVGGAITTAWGFAEAKEQTGIAKENEGKAKTQESLANERATQIAAMLTKEREANEKNLIFADVAKLATARSIEEALYPAFPDKVAALQDWLANYGTPLARRLSTLEQALQDVEARAIPKTEQQRKAARESHSLAPRLQQRCSELESASDEQQRETLREMIKTLENDIAVAGFEFRDAADNYLHRTLVRLVRELRDFCAAKGTLDGVRTRLEQAQVVQQQTIDAHRAQWDEAIAAIRASDLYGHLLLKPQMGLVPLGMDRESKLWEFVHLASGTPDKAIPKRHAATSRLIPDGDMGIVFVLLPGGTLPQDLQVAEGEKKDSRLVVKLDAFFLSKYEMTQGQWLRIAGTNPSVSAKQDDLALPVDQVSWFDCEELLRHQGLELPSRLRWEYGCHGDTRTVWWTGDQQESLSGKENVGGFGVGNRLTIGSLAQNPFGLFDMAGNLWEWCSDYDIKRYGDSPIDPDPGRLVSSFRVIGGGSFANPASFARPGSYRVRAPFVRHGLLGVRPARTSSL